MIEISSVVNMVPAVVMYREDGQEKSVIVYLDYAFQNVIPTEDVGELEPFRKLVFEHITKLKKPAFVPDVPRSGFDISPRAAFNNSD